MSRTHFPGGVDHSGTPSSSSSSSSPQALPRDFVADMEDQLAASADVLHAYDLFESLVDPKPCHRGAFMELLDREQVGAFCRIMNRELAVRLRAMNRLVGKE